MRNLVRKVIKTDGTETDLIGPTSLRDVAKIIGAETLDTVIMRHMGNPMHVMLVDDAGWEFEAVEVSPGHIEHRTIRPRKPINAKATELYLKNMRPGTTHEIAGDVVILPDEDFGP